MVLSTFLKLTNTYAGLKLVVETYNNKSKGLISKVTVATPLDFQKTVRSALADFKPDSIYAVTIRGLGNLGEYNGPLYVDLVDSMALNFSRRAAMAKLFSIEADQKEQPENLFRVTNSGPPGKFARPS
jgi:hypothetical protein